MRARRNARSLPPRAPHRSPRRDRTGTSPPSLRHRVSWASIARGSLGGSSRGVYPAPRRARATWTPGAAVSPRAWPGAPHRPRPCHRDPSRPPFRSARRRSVSEALSQENSSAAKDESWTMLDEVFLARYKTLGQPKGHSSSRHPSLSARIHHSHDVTKHHGEGRKPSLRRADHPLRFTSHARSLHRRIRLVRFYSPSSPPAAPFSSMYARR